MGNIDRRKKFVNICGIEIIIIVIMDDSCYLVDYLDSMFCLVYRFTKCLIS